MTARVPSKVRLRFTSGPSALDAELTEIPERWLETRVQDDSGIEILNSDSSDLLGTDIELRADRPGSYWLAVRYVDGRGNEYEDDFQVDVVEVDRVELRVACDSERAHEPYLIPAGAPVRFSFAAYDEEDRRLDVGDELFVTDFDGFEPSASSKERIAPAEPGRFTWKLGDYSEDVAFEVYEPSDVKLLMSEATSSSTGVPSVTLAASIGDEEVCMSPSPLVATLDVASGECRPAVQNLEFQGGVTLDLAKTSQTVSLAGEGECTLDVTLSTGASLERSFVLLPPKEKAPLSPLTHPFQTTPTELPLFADPEEPLELSECPRYQLTSDGECADPELQGDIDLFDRDCLEDIAWWHSLDEPGYGALESAVLGVDLRAELRLAVQAKTFGLVVRESVPPTALLTTMAPAQGLSWTDLGCLPTERRFEVAPRVSGEHLLTLEAENALRDYEIRFVARDIARTTLRPLDLSDQVTQPGPDTRETEAGSVRHVFVRSDQRLHLDYLDIIDQPLRGLADVLVSSERGEGSAALTSGLARSWTIRAGESKDVILLETPVRGGEHVIHVDDADSIAGVRGVTFEPMRVGEALCPAPIPVADDGLTIAGKSPVLPRLRGTKAQWVVSAPVFGVDGVCLRAVAPGESELVWSWGRGEETVLIRVD